MYSRLHFYYYFLLPIYAEKKYTGFKFSNSRFWCIYMNLGPLNPKIKLLVLGLFVLERVYYQLNSKRNIRRKIKIGISYISLKWRCYLKLSEIACVQRLTQVANPIHYSIQTKHFLSIVTCFDCLKASEMNKTYI